MKIIMALATAALILGPALAQGKIVTKTVEYKHGGTVLEGYLAYDDAVTGQRPGVLVVHQWLGITDHERERARMLAELGYVAFAADIYGRGVRVANPQEAQAQASKYREDPALFRARVAAGLAELKRNELVDGARCAAIGYCFGGGAVLELARSGADVAGVVSFHGSLDTKAPAQPGGVKAMVLVCHGAADPHVKPESVDRFREEMEKARVDYQFIAYSGAVHGFTQKSAGDDPSTGVAYNALADRRSWQHMQDFFAEVLGQPNR